MGPNDQGRRGKYILRAKRISRSDVFGIASKQASENRNCALFRRCDDAYTSLSTCGPLSAYA